jgi:tRNA-specific 2-thiouridylase
MRIVAALSGGVDSAVAAALLVSQGHDVVGVHLRTGAEAEGQGAAPGRSCCGADDARDAREVAARLGIPFYVVDVREAFAREVVAPFAAEYAAGRTPNPCVACNRGVKLGRLGELARGFGAEAVATGHYAHTEERLDGRMRLLRAADRRKDQTYVLHALSQEQLRLARFPLARLTKDEVRAEAARRGLPVATKPDSQELCFVPDGDVRGWLRRHADAPVPPGVFVDEAGREVGRHDGAIGFTRGQRRGLPALGRPNYVLAVDPATARVTIGGREALEDRAVRVERLNWIERDEPEPGTELEVTVQVRHAGVPQPARLRALGRGAAEVAFVEPVFAAAPGQALVAWVGEAVLCGGPVVAAVEAADLPPQQSLQASGLGAPVDRDPAG